MKIVEDYPIISDTSNHEINIVVSKDPSNHVPNLKIRFIIDSVNLRIQKGYLELSDRPQGNLREYTVDEGNTVFYSIDKKISGFLINNTCFPKDVDPEDIQKEMNTLLGATKDKELLQAYRTFCFYYHLVDAGYSISKQIMTAATESENSNPDDTNW